MEADLKYYVQAITAHEPQKRRAYFRTLMIVMGACSGSRRSAGGSCWS
jgi:hypothetical protein